MQNSILILLNYEGYILIELCKFMAELNATCGAESDTQSVVSESQQSLASTDVTTPLSPGEHEPISGDSSQGGYEIPTRLRTLHNLVIQVNSIEITSVFFIQGQLFSKFSV